MDEPIVRHSKLALPKKPRWRDKPLALRTPDDLSGADRKRWIETAREREALWDYRDGFGEWLGEYQWEIFFTGTFADEVKSIEKVSRAFHRFRHILSRKVYGKSFWKYKAWGVSAFVGYEWQKRGSLHLHALLAGLEGLLYSTMREAWDKALRGSRNPSRGYCWIEPYDPKRAFYVTKYVSKDSGPEASWELLGPMWRYPRQQLIPSSG